MQDESLNPYAPPSASIELPADQTTQPVATNGKRFLNFIIDRAAALAFGYGVGLGALFLYEQDIAKGPAEYLQDMGKVAEFFLDIFLTLGFYVICESMGGRSPGKLITGTKAVMNDGSRLKFTSALTRSLCRLIPFEPLSFLSKSGGWHDTITSTKVIDLRARPVPKRVPLRDRALPPGARQIPALRPGTAARPVSRPVFRPAPLAPKPPPAEDS